MEQDTLKQLLNAELEAQSLIDAAERERDELLRRTQEEIRAAEARFEARIPDLRADFLRQAEERARTAIAELERQGERARQRLRGAAGDRAEDAVAAVLRIVLDTGRT